MIPPKHATAEGYFQIDKNSYETCYEYIDGIIRLRDDSTNTHALIGANICAILHNALAEQPYSVYPPRMRVQLSASRYVYPDLTVSCNEREQGDGKTLLYPRLVVEVLSPGTETYDRSNKLRYYRACPTIQEYMLVDTQQPLIEIYRREENNFWTYHTFEAGDIVELACLGVRFPVSEAYRKVKFPDMHPDERGEKLD